MFKKRKEKEAQELSERRLKVEKDFSAAIEAAEKTEDPAERIIELRRINGNITSAIVSETQTRNAKTSKSFKNTTAGGALASAAGGIAAVTLLTHPIGWAIVGGTYLGYAGAVAVGAKRSKIVESKLKRDVSGHLANLGNLQHLVGNKVDDLVENNVEAIAVSPLRDKVLGLPGIAEKFAVASSKNIAKAKEEAAKAVPENKEPVLTKRKSAGQPKQA